MTSSTGDRTVDVMNTKDITAPCPEPGTGRPRHGLGALPVLMAGTFIVVLDFFIVNVALPSMQADLAGGHERRSNGSSPATR